MAGKQSWPQSKSVKASRSSERLGLGAARELGCTYSYGDYICYQDSDDWWSETKIEAQVNLLNQSPAAGMCYCKSALFSELPMERTRATTSQ